MISTGMAGIVSGGIKKMKVIIESAIILIDNKGHTIAASRMERSEKEYYDKHTVRKQLDDHNEELKKNAIALIRTV